MQRAGPLLASFWVRARQRWVSSLLLGHNDNQEQFMASRGVVSSVVCPQRSQWLWQILLQAAGSLPAGSRSTWDKRDRSADTVSERSMPHGPTYMWPVNEGIPSLTNKKGPCMLTNYATPSSISNKALLFHLIGERLISAELSHLTHDTHLVRRARNWTQVSLQTTLYCLFLDCLLGNKDHSFPVTVCPFLHGGYGHPVVFW